MLLFFHLRGNGFHFVAANRNDFPVPLGQRIALILISWKKIGSVTFFRRMTYKGE